MRRGARLLSVPAHPDPVASSHHPPPPPTPSHPPGPAQDSSRHLPSLVWFLAWLWEWASLWGLPHSKQDAVARVLLDSTCDGNRSQRRPSRVPSRWQSLACRCDMHLPEPHPHAAGSSPSDTRCREHQKTALPFLGLACHRFGKYPLTSLALPASVAAMACALPVIFPGGPLQTRSLKAVKGVG